MRPVAEYDLWLLRLAASQWLREHAEHEAAGEIRRVLERTAHPAKNGPPLWLDQSGET